MAGDVVALMRHLGRDRFSVVGPDRGTLVAFRTAMDHPEAVQRLVVMDGLPVIGHLERLNEAFARTWWHWWFLGQKPRGPFGPTSDTHSDWDPSAASARSRPIWAMIFVAILESRPRTNG
jgi:pimeloyl-ACP methyl ester carboxylesterase